MKLGDIAMTLAWSKLISAIVFYVSCFSYSISLSFPYFLTFISLDLFSLWDHSFPSTCSPSSRSRDLAFHSDIAWSYDRWALRVGNSRKLQSTGRNEHDPTTMMNCKILRQHIVLCLQGWTLWCALGSVNMRRKNCVTLPAAERRTQLFHLIFTEPRAHH